MNEKLLEEIYLEMLDERLIAYLAENYGLSYQKAMDLYY
jgi:hypothetical protein